MLSAKVATKLEAAGQGLCSNETLSSREAICKSLVSGAEAVMKF